MKPPWLKPDPFRPYILPEDSVEQRYSVPPEPVVPASCTVDWLRPVAGESAISWWRVDVWTNVLIATVDGVPVPSKRAVYELKAMDDNMAAELGLRRFEKEHRALN